jgi:hypothetical protein
VFGWLEVPRPSRSRQHQPYELRTHTCTEPPHGSTRVRMEAGCKVTRENIHQQRRERSEPTSRISFDPTGTARRRDTGCQNSARLQGFAPPRHKQARPCTLRAVLAVPPMRRAAPAGSSSIRTECQTKTLDIDQPSHGSQTKFFISNQAFENTRRSGLRVTLPHLSLITHPCSNFLYHHPATTPSIPPV